MYAPMLAASAEPTQLKMYIEDDKWVIEQKLDGHRILLVDPQENMPPTAITRNGNLYSKGIPTAVRNFRFPAQGAHPWVLDGELVDGTYWVFDLLSIPTDGSFGQQPLHVRRAGLEALLANVPHPFKLVPQAKAVDEKIRLAEIAIEQNFEGLMLKHRDSKNEPGRRSSTTLKLKFTATADVIVMDVRDDGKDSVRLGLFDPALDKVVEVGRSSLIGKEKKGAIVVGEVLEVKYLYVGAGGRLYQPTILHKRPDKVLSECTPDQLKPVNKEVLEAIA